MEVQVERLVEISFVGEAALLLHEVAHGEVPVRGRPLGQEHRVVKPEKLVTFTSRRHPSDSEVHAYKYNLRFCGGC